MNTKFESSFTVYPEHANCMTPLIFGGAFFSQLDKAAATTVHRFLYGSNCTTAVTHKFEGTFHLPCYVGDLIFIESEITNTGKKSVVVETKAFRENRRGVRELVAEAKFVFISVLDESTVSSKPRLLPYSEHNMAM